MGYECYKSTPEIPATDEARLHVLFLCCTRYVVEKHGGVMETDPDTYNAYVSIPESNKVACLDELEMLFGCDGLTM
jgi:hypothetical protein